MKINSFVFVILTVFLLPSVSALTYFESNWTAGTGNSPTNFQDGGRWDNGCCEASASNVLSVVTPASIGLDSVIPAYTGNVLRVQMRGWSTGVLQKQNAYPESTTHYARFYFRNDESGNRNDHGYAYNNLHSGSGSPIQAAPFSRFALDMTGTWRYRLFTQNDQDPDFAYPYGSWYSPVLQNGVWYRMEYQFEYVTATTYRIWPRIYDASGTLLYDSDDFLAANIQTRDGTLTEFYDIGGQNRVALLGVLNDGPEDPPNPANARHVSIGNEGPSSVASNYVGNYWYYAGLALCDTWCGPITGAAPPPPADTTPPTATITAPTAAQILIAGTTSTTLSVTTNETATCRWSMTDVAYASMPNTMTGSGSTSHTATLSGLVDGSTNITYVRCSDTAGNAMITSASRSFSIATPVVVSGFTNEPAGFTALGEWNDETTLNASGWIQDGVTTWGSKSRVTSGYTGIPTVGGTAVIQTFYPGGVDGGYDPQRMQFSLPANTNEVFMGVEVQYAANYPTSTSSGGNKQFFVTFADGGRYFVNFDRGLAANRWGVYVSSTPLVDSSITLVKGSWIKVEWYLKRNPGANDDIMRLWIDGTLAIERTDLTFPTGNMMMAYDDGSNNGNRPVTGVSPEVRIIASEYPGAPLDAYRWVSALYVSVPGQAPADTTPPTATITAPTANQQLAADTTSTSLTVTTSEAATCKWSATDIIYASMPNTMTGSGSTSHTATLSGLVNGGTNTTYIRCSDTAQNNMTTSESVSFSVNSTPVTVDSQYRLFFFEPFEPSSTFTVGAGSGQNWYDLGATPVMNTTERIAGSTQSMEWRWTQGAMTPPAGTMRRLFNTSETLYLSYWVKHSPNWVGSNLPYHPHMFYFLNDRETAYRGPAFTRSTLYVEHTLNRLYLGAQDGVNIDQSRINQNLIGVTENRSANGCNGNIEPGIGYSCYNNGGTYWNGKMVTSTTTPFSDTPGANYKGDWQFVETYFQMNTVTNGVGNTDGIITAWVDGELVYNRTDHFFRTGYYPDLSFNQFFMGPYIGAGSPVDQTMWIDNLTVANRRPGTTAPSIIRRAGDLNNDGVVNILDVSLIIQNFKRRQNYDEGADINSDGTVNILDMVLLGRNWG